jgi:hypothetical protein
MNYKKRALAAKLLTLTEHFPLVVCNLNFNNWLRLTRLTREEVETGVAVK